MFDGDLSTGWRPATGGALTLVLDAPITADQLVVTPCKASPSATYPVEVNGGLAGAIDAKGDGTAQLQLGAAGAGWRVAEVSLRSIAELPGTCVA